VRLALTLTLLVLAVLAPAARAATGETRIIVGRDPGLTAGERASIRQDAGVRLVRTLRIANTEVVTTGDPTAALAQLRSDPDVQYAEIDRVRHAFTNDPGYAGQWALDNTGSNLHDNFTPALAYGTPNADMNVPEAWLRGALGAGVTVAVVDSGVEATHPDLAGQIASGSRGFVGGVDGGFVDGYGHGTHVSGIIAAASGNSQGIAGIAPGAKVVALKALDDTGSGNDSDIAAAFDYAGDHGIRIVNASLGGVGASTTLTNAMARHPGTLYVIAAGNSSVDNDTNVIWPCNAPVDNIVCVGASTQNDVRAGFSNYGARNVDLFAPGEDIYSTFKGGAYKLQDGTSMASPAVAAEAALVLSVSPTLPTAQLKSILLQAVDAKPDFSGKSVTGGRANADSAVTLAGATPIDTDGDGVPDGRDPCPTVFAQTANGCPPPPPSAPTPLSTFADRDGDGRTDALDACPAEPAATPDGCPIPGLRSVAVTSVKRKHRVSVRVATDRRATVSFKVERKVCAKRCRWRPAASNAVVTRNDVASFSRTLSRGSYRVSVRLSSTAGQSRPTSRSFNL
jgi:subtilisin family serine protease